MTTTHSLHNLKCYHNEAVQFFGSELILLKEVVPKIVDDRLAKAAVLLITSGQTGAALIQLANQIDRFTSESVILARAFMEKVTNFCYVGICDEKEYRAFILHPIYKHFHNIGSLKIEDDLNFIFENVKARKEKQEKLMKVLIVQEALAMFSATNSHLNWTKKTLNQRIAAIAKWGKLLDVFFTINKIQYYSDASEVLHGSLYGCTYDIGLFEPDFDPANKEGLYKKLYKDSTCILLHLGMLIHESFTLISYSNDIKEQWNYSYQNRNNALNLLFHVLEIKNMDLEKIKASANKVNKDRCHSKEI
jgi:hypothetical protein